MRQIVITKHGGPDVLQLQEREDPQPAAGEVLVDVRSCGINFADILARKGLYPDAPRPPCVVGYELSGVVIELGEGGDESLLGEPVIAITKFGGYADRVPIPQATVFPKPESLSHEEAAALPVNYLTAYQLLAVMGSLQEGESVLIHNAGGGVGLAALDIAKRLGATTYGTASPRKHEFLMERGLDHPIDYQSGDWTRAIRQLTGGRGVELIIDPIGGAHWKKSWKALRPTGRLGMFGISRATESRLGGILSLIHVAMRMPWFHPVGLMNSNRGVFGVNLGHLWGEGAKVRSWMEKVLKGVEDGWVRPHVDRAFSFESAATAHRYIEDRKNSGKVVLLP